MTRRLLAPLAMFVTVMAMLALAGVHRIIDYTAFRALTHEQDGALALSDEIRLVDLPYPESLRARGDPTLFRARLAELLDRLAADPAQLPRIVVLDVWFSKDDRGLAELSNAIARLEQASVQVHAAFNPDADGKTSRR
jgi:CHASE2 domain-containing sensor protein